MQCKCGGQTVQRTLSHKGESASYEQCQICKRQHVWPLQRAQFEKVKRLKDGVKQESLFDEPV